MKTKYPQWVNHIARRHQETAVAIWEEHLEAVRKARRVFEDALVAPREQRSRSIAVADERYNMAKRQLRDLEREEAA